MGTGPFPGGGVVITQRIEECVVQARREAVSARRLVCSSNDIQRLVPRTVAQTYRESEGVK
jgi:hypothetical protein